MKKTQYAKIYFDLIESIQAGQLKEGDQLPTELELAKTYGVSRITSKKALDLLAQENKIVRIAGKGSFVQSGAKTHFHNKTASHLIGVAISGFSAAFGDDILDGIQQACAEYNNLMVLTSSYNNQESELQEISRLIKMGVSGLILMPFYSPSYNPIILENLLNDFPMVMIDRYLPGLSVPYVGTDNERSAKDITEYLFEKGHKNIAFFSTMCTTTAIQERINGYMNAYAHSKFPLDFNLIATDLKCTMPGMGTPEIINEDLNRARNLIQENPQVTAVIAADHGVARLLQIALNQLGKRIPEDFSLICYDQPTELFLGQHYTHVQQDQHAIGYKAAQLLFETIEHKAPLQTHHLIDYTLVDEGSVTTLI